MTITEIVLAAVIVLDLVFAITLLDQDSFVYQNPALFPSSSGKGNFLRGNGL
jgi:hypothetical protein